MTRGLLWKLCLIFMMGIVSMFYLIDYLASRAEEEMSMLADEDRQELKRWGARTEQLYREGNMHALERWLLELEEAEGTHAAVVKSEIQRIVGNNLNEEYYSRFNLGRSVDWKIHLAFHVNPVMEIPFQKGDISFLVKLPDRMQPGSLWLTMRLTLQVVFPMLLLAVLALLLYRHIMKPLNSLQKATREFTLGDFSVRVRNRLGKRNDEFSDLANTFDQMAARIGEQIISQRQLISDLSHELRTPLTRMDIALDSAAKEFGQNHDIERAQRESQQIRRLVEDALTLAWLENERPQLAQEDLDLVDLIDVIVDDASFEFPSRKIQTHLPSSAPLPNSNHRAVGQAIENVVRNALRYSPEGETVFIKLEQPIPEEYLLVIQDSGPGVPPELLETIFQPFFRVDKARAVGSKSFGLGLALARRQLAAVGGKISAQNGDSGGLIMSVTLPCC